AQVHQHHVRGQLGDEPDRLLPVPSGADDLDTGEQSEQHHDALAHHRLVVRHHDPGRLAALLFRHTGTFNVTTNPSSPGPASSKRGGSASRPRIPSRPYPAPDPVNSPGDPPESRTFSTAWCSSNSSRMCTLAPGACLRTFVMASCATLRTACEASA